ncbi:MAG: ATP-binding protein [Cocleimonas sp.]
MFYVISSAVAIYLLRKKSNFILTSLLFDPYFTTKEQTGGTGLGLYIARIIVQQIMDGKLLASNTKDGAKFTITIKKADSLI